MTAELHGRIDGRFDSVRTLLDGNLASGAEHGVSLAVDIDGESVIDTWGGFRDSAAEQPWERDTITNVWSITKAVTALAALMLVDRGELDIHAPVARYWPEFGAGGKEDVEVRHILSHTSGVSGLANAGDVSHLYSWDSAVAQMASQVPWWTPGTASGYHLMNQGHLVGEIVRRITGKTLKRFVADEIAGPLKTDFQIGAATSDRARIAALVPPPPLDFDIEALDHSSPAYKTFTGPPVAPEDAGTAAWRAADIGAANGHGNARSVVGTLSVITLGGEVDGVRLLGPQTIGMIFEEQSNGIDLVNGLHLRWGLGLALPHRETLSWIPDGKIAFWGGWGGSMIILDVDRHMTIAYVMNKMGPGILGSPRSQAYVSAIYAEMD